MTVAEDKAALRRVYAAKRAAMTEDERLAKSAELNQILFSLPEVARARTIGLYWAHGSEVSTPSTVQQLLSQGKRIFLPVSFSAGRQLRFFAFDGRLETLSISPIGVFEPMTTGEEAFELDLILVPGIAFDRHGYRLGHGAGYYDRYLKTISCPKVGLAFQAQIADTLPRNNNDVPVDMIITETGSIAISNRIPSHDSV